MSCGRPVCLRVCKERTQEDLKGRSNYWAPIYFASLNEITSVSNIAKTVRKPKNLVVE